MITVLIDRHKEWSSSSLTDNVHWGDRLPRNFSHCFEQSFESNVVLCTTKSDCLRTCPRVFARIRRPRIPNKNVKVIIFNVIWAIVLTNLMLFFVQRNQIALELAHEFLRGYDDLQFQIKTSRWSSHTWFERSFGQSNVILWKSRQSSACHKYLEPKRTTYYIWACPEVKFTNFHAALFQLTFDKCLVPWLWQITWKTLVKILEQLLPMQNVLHWKNEK
jgi:hypothetical protein